MPPLSATALALPLGGASPAVFADICGDGIDQDRDGADAVCATGPVFGGRITSSAEAAALCTRGDRVVGDLQISMDSERVSLAGLHCLTAVDGTLTIHLNEVTHLRGLDGLTSLGGLSLSKGRYRRSGHYRLLPAVQQVGRVELHHVDEVDMLDAVESMGSLSCHQTSWDTATSLSRLGSLDVDGCERLSALGAVTELTDSAWIRGEMMVGLERLAHVGGNLTLDQIYHNTQLMLDRLETVGGDLEFWCIRDTTNPLPSLSRVAGDLRVYPNSLDRIHGFEALESVDGRLSFVLGVNFSHSGQGVIEGFDRLEEVGEDIYVDEYSWWSSTDAQLVLPSVETVGGSISVEVQGDITVELPMATDIGSIRLEPRRGISVWLPHLRTLGTLDLQGQRWTTPIGGLELGSLETIEELVLHSLDFDGELDVSALSHATLIDLESVAGLGDLDLSELGVLEGYLRIEDADGMDSLDLSVLDAVGGDFTIRGALELVDVTAPELVEVTGDLKLEDNRLLSGLWMPSLVSVGDGVSLKRNRDMTDLDGLSALSMVGSSLELEQLYRLQEVDGLASLDRVGGSLILDRNPVLVDVEGLHGLSSVRLHLKIIDNPWLRASRVDALLEAIGTVSGTVTVSGNGP